MSPIPWLSFLKVLPVCCLILSALMNTVIIMASALARLPSSQYKPIILYDAIIGIMLSIMNSIVNPLWIGTASGFFVFIETDNLFLSQCRMRYWFSVWMGFYFLVISKIALNAVYKLMFHMRTRLSGYWEYVFGLAPIILIFVFTPISFALLPETSGSSEIDAPIRNNLLETHDLHLSKVFYLQLKACDLDQSVSCLNQLLLSKIALLVGAFLLTTVICCLLILCLNPKVPTSESKKHAISCVERLRRSFVYLTISILLIYVPLALLFFQAALGVDIGIAASLISATFPIYSIFSTLSILFDNPLHAKGIFDCLRRKKVVHPMAIETVEVVPPRSGNALPNVLPVSTLSFL